jgi:hypothetical protein
MDDKGAPKPDTPEASDDDSMRDLLRSALSVERTPPPDMLAGVQRRIRQRSRGKFYRDRWAVEKHPPINTYLVTAVLMLVILFVAYALLRPLSGASNSVDNEPAPVHVIPPPRR